ncbi:MAG: histidine kinase dimerization/phospho-acceptor domain-containing protein [Allosphingosinicella sp.]
MRFDDMIATVLAQREDGPSALAAKWRQLVDLLAQRRGEAPGEALAWLASRRGEVPAAERAAAAAALAGRRVAPDVLTFFADDDPRVAGPLLSTARLTGAEWVALLPSLTPTARAFLRHRRDLPREVERALAGFGAADFALAGTVAAAPGRASPSIEQSETQIRDLVARIENFRRRRGVVPPAAPSPDAPVEAFHWETGPDGTILWIDGAPRGPLVGQSIASIAERGQFGVDGQAAGAFEKRAPFRDARFSVAGGGAASGDWRISGVPFFDPGQGHFLGYRGSARRPRVDEVARAEPGAAEAKAGLFGTDLPPDALRQLIHELRTPLNAIIGFAEMIEGQYMGPAASGYRSRAGTIMEQAKGLLSAVDDLDTAARIETRRLQLAESSVDAVALLCRLHDAYERVAQQRGSRIAIEIERDLPPARVELGAAERMFARMLAATIGLAGEGETIGATMTLGQLAGRPMLCLSIDRPRAIDGLDEAALLDPGYSPEGDWPGAPALGLGFALRLVRNLADAVGGGLAVGETRFFLYLPPLEPAERSTGNGA